MTFPGRLAVLSSIAAVGTVVGVLVFVTGHPDPPASPPTPVGQAAPPVVYGQGWVNDPAAVAAVVTGLDIQAFADTPAFRAADDDDHAYLWDAAKSILGRHIPTRNQGQVGSCVSFGWACGAEYLQVAQIAAGRAETFKDVAQECIYGGSRVQVGGGRIGGDGSVGAWAAKWCADYGIVARGKYDRHDLTAYSESTCRSFGRSGCPKELESEAKLHPIRTVAPCKSAAELKKALLNFYPVPVCSNQGFSSQRDDNGTASPQGSWAHAMCFIGWRSQPRSQFFVMNSWGPYWIRGPTGPGDPPPGGFWCDEGVADRMLRQNDSFAVSDLNGFPARKIDWFARAAPRRPADRFARVFKEKPHAMAR